MNATANTPRITPIASALGVKEIPTTAEKTVQPIRRDYSGIPKTGFVRLSQIARNPKKPDAPAPVPVSPVTIWRWVKDGKFPAPVKLSGNVTAWRAEEIRAWLDQQPA